MVLRMSPSILAILSAFALAAPPAVAREPAPPGARVLAAAAPRFPRSRFDGEWPPDLSDAPIK